MKASTTMIKIARFGIMLIVILASGSLSAQQVSVEVNSDEKMRVTEDSAVVSTQLNVINGGFLVEGDNGITRASGPGVRMMWVPSRAAFRAGMVDGAQWNHDSIGYATFSGGGLHHILTGDFSFIGGGSENRIAGIASFIGGGMTNIANEYASFIGGGHDNIIDGQGSFIGGGHHHRAIGAYSYIGGGDNNETHNEFSFIGGGRQNQTYGSDSFIGGGQENIAHGNQSYIGGGANNQVAGQYGYIGGGSSNLVSEHGGFIGGGKENLVLGMFSSITSGLSNVVTGARSSVVSGQTNYITSNFSTIAGGENNSIVADYSFIGGGEGNIASGTGSFLGGGFSNILLAPYSFMAGGSGNLCFGSYSFISGRELVSSASGQVTFGQYNVEIAGSPNNWVPEEPIFIIGNGLDPSNRNNAITILKNGAVGLQSTITPEYALDIPNDSDVLIGSGRATSWLTHSDSRIKSHVRPLSYGLAEVMRIEPVAYYQHNTVWSDGRLVKQGGSQSFGVLAQELYKVIPEVVSKPADENTSLWAVDYARLTPVLIKAVQEQQAEIDALKEELAELKALILSKLNAE
jgi:hypothetical protein